MLEKINSEGVGMDRITVTVVWSTNRKGTQSRAWQAAMAQRGWAVRPHANVVECWEAALQALGLNATQCDDCGTVRSFSVSGPVMCLQELLAMPILRVEYREAAVPHTAQGQTKKPGSHSQDRHD